MNTHYVITNREIVTNPKKKSKYMQVNEDEYIRIDGKELAREDLRFGSYSFANKKDKGTLTIFPEGDIETLDGNNIDSLPSYQLFDGVYNNMSSMEEGKGDTLVFIHGYNTDLEDALENVRVLHDLYVENDDSPINTIIIFTWSSKSNLLGYREDARDAKTSGFAFGRSIVKFISFLHYLKESDKTFCNQNIHLLAHSHGNKVLEWTMLELSDDVEYRLNDLFANILLLAPDVDRDALDSPNPLYDLVDISEKVHVFYHRRDTALVISENSKHPLNRLGRRGPKNELKWLKSDYKEYDVTRYKDDLGNIKQKMFNHWYYYTSSKVINIIIDIFKIRE